MPGVDGLLHVSEIANYRVKDVRDELKEGEQIMVKVINIDPSGKVRLSRKALLAPEGGVPPSGEGGPREGGERPRREGGRDAGGRGGFRGDRDRDRAARPRAARTGAPRGVTNGALCPITLLQGRRKRVVRPARTNRPGATTTSGSGPGFTPGPAADLGQPTNRPPPSS